MLSAVEMARIESIDQHFRDAARLVGSGRARDEESR